MKATIGNTQKTTMGKHTSTCSQAQGEDVRPHDLLKLKCRACKAHTVLRTDPALDCGHTPTMLKQASETPRAHTRKAGPIAVNTGVFSNRWISSYSTRMCHFCILFYLGRSGEFGRVSYKPVWPQTPWVIEVGLELLLFLPLHLKCRDHRHAWAYPAAFFKFIGDLKKWLCS